MKNGGHKSNSGIKPHDLDISLNRGIRDDEGVAYANSDYQLQYFNPCFERIYERVFGRRVLKYESLAVTSLFNSLAEGVKILEQVLAGASMEWPLLDSEPDSPCVTMCIEPSRGKSGNVNGILVYLQESKPGWAANHINFKSMLESSGDAVILFSPEGKPMYASPSVTEVLGYTQDEILQLDMYSSVHPDDLAGNQKVMEKAIFNPGIPIKGYVSRIMHKDGTYHWYDSTVVNLLNDPAVGGIVDNIREVTDHVQTGKMSSDIGDLYDMVTDNAGVGVWELDLQTRLCRRNLQHDLIFGYREPVAEWTPELFFSHVHPGDKPEVRKKFYESLQNGHLELDVRIIWPDKTERWVQLKGKAMTHEGGSEKFAGTITDVTEIHSAREALAASNYRLKKIVENLPDGLVIAGSQGDPLYWNPAALQLHGFSQEKEGARQLAEFLKLFKLQTENGEPLPFKEWPLPRLLRNEPVKSLKLNVSNLKQGWRKFFQYSGGSFPDIFGKEMYFLTISEIPADQPGIKSIKQGEQNFWEAFHLSPGALAISRKSDMVCLDLNKCAEELLGYTYDEYMEKKLLQLNIKPASAFKAFQKAFRSSTGLYTGQEAVVHTPNGRRRIKMLTIEHITLDSEDCRLSILIDISA